MRLTNNIRDAFVRAAMHDVPKEDFETPAKKAFEDGMRKHMPKEIADILKKNGPAAEWIHMDFLSTPDSLSNWKSACPRSAGYRYLRECVPELWNALTEFSTKIAAQNKQRMELSDKLKGAAYSCTTRKQLAELLPEFEKYLPEDEAKAMRTLPVVANLVAEFTKAGWPATNKTV